MKDHNAPPQGSTTETDPVVLAFSDLNAPPGGRIVDSAEGPMELYRAATELGQVTTERGRMLFRHDDIVALCRHADVVMWDPIDTGYVMLGADHPLGPHSRDGREHTRFRKLVDPHFAPRRMAERTDQVRTLARQLIDQFVDDGHVEAFGSFAVPLPSRIFLDLLGLDPDDAHEWIQLKDGILRGAAGASSVEEVRRIQLAAGQRLRDHVAPMLDARLSEPGAQQGLIDMLLHTEIDGERLAREEVIDVIQLLVIAGLDTVTSSISCFLARLAQHPDERDALVADPALIPTAVEELLRYESPVPAGERWAAKDLEINGVKFAAGDSMEMIWGAANMDPLAIERPDRIDFHRPTNRHIAFAAGPHRCLGSHLARLELRIALEEWLRRIPDFRITPGQKPIYVGVGVRCVPFLPLSWS
jgi:cytochrome P450